MDECWTEVSISLQSEGFKILNISMFDTLLIVSISLQSEGFKMQ